LAVKQMQISFEFRPGARRVYTNTFHDLSLAPVVFIHQSNNSTIKLD